jgi:hypothetical protein
MTKNRGSENTIFFVRKEEFQAKTDRTAEGELVKRDGFLHKTACFVQ